MELLIWAGKVSLYWLVFYGCFYFFLRKLTHFKWNRVYLITSLILPLVLPLLTIPPSATESIALYTGQLDTLLIVPQAGHGAFPLFGIFCIAYIAGVSIMLYRLFTKLRHIQQIWQKTFPIEAEDGVTEIHIFPDDKIRSFSFLNKIGISQSDYVAHFGEILSHEIVHVKQRHSLDILLVEVLRCFFWFHPILRLYKKSMQEIHEFLADQDAFNRDAHAEFLVAYTLGQPQLSLVNNLYNSSLLKQRIQMLYSNKSPKWKMSLYGLTGLLTFAMIFLIAACSEPRRPTLADESQQTPRTMKLPGEEQTLTAGGEKVFMAVEKIPEFPGGVPALYNYLSTNIKYPYAAKSAKIEGRVFLQFIVGTDGSISEVTVVKGIGFGCDEEAIRVVKAMPKWIGGRQSGVPVNVKYTLPINFQLETAEIETSPSSTEVPAS